MSTWQNPWGGTSGLQYQGLWDASTNTPTLASGVGTQNHYYIVSVAGSTNLDGITSWGVGDWALFNGSVWQKLDNSDAVTSWNSRTGAVIPQVGDYSLDQISAGNLTVGAYYQDIQEITTPANPAANVARIYAKDDGGTTKLAYRDSAGTETVIQETTPAGSAGDFQYNFLGVFGAAPLNYSGTEYFFSAAHPIKVHSIVGQSGVDLTIRHHNTPGGLDSLEFRNDGHVYPGVGGTTNLGANGTRWNNVFANFLNASNYVYTTDIWTDGIKTTGGSNLITVATNVFRPTTNSVVSLGDLSYKFLNFYTDNAYISNYLDIPEQTTPGNPGANIGRVYVADDGGTTTLYFRDNAGTETDLLSKTTPGGSDTQIQYNNSGVFAGANMTFDGSNFAMTGSARLDTTQVRAADANGLLLNHTDATGIFIGGTPTKVGIREITPQAYLELNTGLASDDSWVDSGITPATAFISGDAHAYLVSDDGGTWGSMLHFVQLDISEATDFENAWSLGRKTNGDGSGDGSFQVLYGTTNTYVNGGARMILGTSGQATFNPTSLSNGDFTVNTNTGVGLFVDAGAEQVAIGHNSPSQALDLVGAFELQDTTSSTTGVIYKGATRYLHNFHHPTGGTAVPEGYNLFWGLNAGNFTVGSTAANTWEGSSNLGIGNYTLLSLTTGYFNIATGRGAGQDMTTGFSNSLYGGNAGRHLLSGTGNAYFGGSAGRYIDGGADNTTSYNCVCLGQGTRLSANGVNNEVVIGTDAIGNGTNTVTIGNTSITETILRPVLGIGTTTPSSTHTVHMVYASSGSDAGLYIENTSTGAASIRMRANSQQWNIMMRNDAIYLVDDRAWFTDADIRAWFGNRGAHASGINVGGTPQAEWHVNQDGSTAAKPVIRMDQADVDVEFTYYQGTAASGVLTNSLVDDGDVTTATLVGWKKCYVNDLGNQITDGNYFEPFYSLS